MRDARKKALLIPMNARREFFIQDRRGHKPPPWGLFGGGIEEGETALEAVIRESKEELDVEIAESELIDLGDYPKIIDDQQIERRMFLWPTEQTEFTVLEGAGGVWLTSTEARKRLSFPEHLDKVWSKIEEVLK